MLVAKTGSRSTEGHRRLRLPYRTLQDTFGILRDCGHAERECQALWIGPWSDPLRVSDVVHPLHRAVGDGFALDETWLRSFWLRLAKQHEGVRAQVHTHPRSAFHSPTDDQWPIVSSEGFLSLVIPDFAQGAVGFAGAYLTEITSEGDWSEVKQITDRIDVIK